MNFMMLVAIGIGLNSQSVFDKLIIKTVGAETLLIAIQNSNKRAFEEGRRAKAQEMRRVLEL